MNREMVYGIAVDCYDSYKLHFQNVMSEVVSAEGRCKNIVYVSSNDMASMERLNGYGIDNLTMFVCDRFYTGKFANHIIDRFNERGVVMVDEATRTKPWLCDTAHLFALHRV